jgi:hypothetical protein
VFIKLPSWTKLHKFRRGKSSRHATTFVSEEWAPSKAAIHHFYAANTLANWTDRIGVRCDRTIGFSFLDNVSYDNLQSWNFSFKHVASYLLTSIGRLAVRAVRLTPGVFLQQSFPPEENGERSVLDGVET